MQILNLHAVESVKISSTQGYKTAHWKKITISYEGGQFEVVLFTEKTNIPIVFDVTTPLKESDQ